MIGTFLSAPTCPILEFSLSMFGKWYQDLTIAKVMSHNESEHCEEQWQYNVILWYPKRKGEKLSGQSALPMLFMLRSSMAHLRICTVSIWHCFLIPKEWLHPLCSNEFPGFSKTISQTKDVVPFYNGTGNECCSSYVVCLLLAPFSASKPLQITSWRGIKVLDIWCW